MQQYTPPYVQDQATPSPLYQDNEHLMALLSFQSTGGCDVPTLLELPSSSPQAFNSSSHVSLLPPAPLAPALPSAPPIFSSARLTTNQLPRGRHLHGDYVIYDVDDVRLPGEAPPQLEVTPITMYASQPVLLHGRQIAVNRSYICYGLRPNRHIRILSINTASRSLLRGHSERVTDMAFFAEDVHLLASASSDGRVFVRKIVEGPDKDNNLQITDEILLAIQFDGDCDTVHPRVCWLCHNQDVLVVGMSKHVYLVDILRVRQTAAPNGFDIEEPVRCAADNLLDGVRCIIEHDGEVTDISTSQLAVLASASKDGTIRVWKDQSMSSLGVLTPHEGQQIGAVAFLSAPHRPDHIVLLSAGPLIQELKLWVPAIGEGWFPQTGRVMWKCIQTLKLTNSAGGRAEDAFFNQVIVVPFAHVILLANAKRSALYIVHVDYGLNPSATRLDYLTEFSVVWPILSFTAINETVIDGDGIIQVYCVQTQAIQQYSLDLSQCLPPIKGQTAVVAQEKDLVYGSQVSSVSISTRTMSPEGPNNAFEVSSILRAKSPGPISGVSLASEPLGARKMATFGASDYVPTPGNQFPPSNMDMISVVDSKVIGVSTSQVKEVPTKDVMVHVSKVSAPAPQTGGTSWSPRGSPLAKAKVRSSTDDGPTFHEVSPREQVDYLCSYEQAEHLGERIGSNVPSSPTKGVWDPLSSSPRRHDSDIGRMNEDKEWPSPANMSSIILESQNNTGSSMHLITPSELMSMVARSKKEGDGGSSSSSPRGAGILKELVKPVSTLENHMAKRDFEALMVETKEMTEGATFHLDKNGSKKVVLLRRGSPNLGSKIEHSSAAAYEYTDTDTFKEESVIEQVHFDQDPDSEIVEETSREEDNEAVEEKESSQILGGEESCEQLQEVAVKVHNSAACSVVSQTRRKKNKNKTDNNLLVSLMPSSSTPMAGALASMASTSEQDPSKGNSSVSVSMLAAQITGMQDSVNQLIVMQREFQKQMQIISAVPIAKEVKRVEGVLGQRMEKVLRAHIDAMWARLQEDNAKHEKAEKDQMQQLTTYFLNYLNKDLPAALERALKKEFSSFGPPVARLVVPSVEKSISIAVNEAFQKGINEKGIAQIEKSVGAKIEASLSRQMQAQFQTSGKNALQEALRTCLEGSVIPSIERSCQAMFGQVDAACQKTFSEHQSLTQQQVATSALVSNLQETVASAASLAASLKGDLADGQRRLLAFIESGGVSRGAYMINGSIPDKAMTVQHVEESLDPTKELGRLILERKVEEAFNKALSLTDVGVVSWLCNQVDLAALLTTTPLPLSQGVLLALVQQLGCDLGNDTGKKLMWIKDAALALNPHDPGLPPHVMRHFLEKLYNNLHALLGTSLSSDVVLTTRLVIHVVNSLLSACK